MTDDGGMDSCSLCEEEDAFVECILCERVICWSCVGRCIPGDLYKNQPDEHVCEACVEED